MGMGSEGLVNNCWSWVRLLRKALRVVMACRETERETEGRLLNIYGVFIEKVI